MDGKFMKESCFIIIVQITEPPHGSTSSTFVTRDIFASLFPWWDYIIWMWNMPTSQTHS